MRQYMDMVFLKKREVKGKDYYYASASVGGKQKDIYYFGAKKPRKEEFDAVVQAYDKKDIYTPKEALLKKEQNQRLEELNKQMKKELLEMSGAEREKFNEKYYNDYIYNTNSIEGSTLTREETYFVTHNEQGIEGKSLKELYMARNLAKAVEFLQAYTGDVDLKLIRKLHEIVQLNIEVNLGEFKRIQNYIVGTDYLPTPPKFVDERMAGLVRWLSLNKKKYHPFELACIFHIKYVSIHPFVDGNGRTARLLHNLILNRAGFLPITYRNSTKRRYYTTLRNAQVHGGHEPFLEYSVEEFVNTYEGY